ncbi:transcription factor UPBEAT1-like [Cornus florida]|uniref:transcription factor UPBEAT1-like n=1 Tax=Cornus florida TaxID=4283 RepID=UPI0028A13B68|nr:transcription factor UPBEAT1-like [Cornus florida]
MGAPPKSLHALDLKGMVLENKGTSQSSIGSLWSKVMKAQSIKTNMGGHGRSGRHRRILMKRRALLEGSRRPVYGIERKVRTLKKLVPNGKSKPLDGLFRDTNNYIVLLQTRVKVMKMMIQLCSKTDE